MQLSRFALALTALLLAPRVTLRAAEAPAASGDLALQPPSVIGSPTDEQISPTKRQGVAEIERTPKGRMWTVDGRNVESDRNYAVVRFSDGRNERRAAADRRRTNCRQGGENLRRPADGPGRARTRGPDEARPNPRAAPSAAVPRALAQRQRATEARG